MYDTADDIQSFSFNFDLHCRQDILLTFRQNVAAQVAYFKIIRISLNDLSSECFNIDRRDNSLSKNVQHIRLLSKSEFF